MLAQIGAIPTFTTWEKYITWVPKSKIKEKIEEYRQEMKEIRAKEKGLIWNHRLHKLDYAIQVLQELMEDK